MASKTKGKTAVKEVEKEKVEEPLDEQELESLYSWVDSIPLTRPKKNISRDFSDGVLVAEIMDHFFPKMVELHNYTPANSSDKKFSNWHLLNRKVFSKLNFELAEEVINDLVQCKPGMIEKVLLMLQVKIRRAEYWRSHHSDKPEADQHQHQMTPGRKDNRMIKVGMEDTKGSRFAKTKQSQKDIDYYAVKEIECELIKKVKFKDEQDCKNKKGKRLQEQKSPPKNPPKKPDVIPKRRPGPLLESDVVPRYVVEEKEQEILSREETIQILQAKISRLEHLLHLKDMRIDDLQGRVESMRPTGIKK